MQLLQHGWFRWVVIGLCAVGLSASTGCKPESSKSKGTGTGTKPQKNKEAGGKEGGAEGQKGGGKKGGGKKGGGKKGGGKKGGGKGKKEGGKEGQGKSAGSQTKEGQSKGGEGSGGKRGGGKGGGQKDAGATKPPVLIGIAFTVPADWKASATTKPDEKLQASYDLPAKAGVEGKGTLLVHNQPEAKGKAKETINQLYTKMKPAAGAKETSPTITETTTTDGIKITMGDMVGTIEGRKSDDPSGKPSTLRVITAFIEDAQGPHTVRATGPQAFIDASADSIVAFIKSVKPKT